MAVQGIAFTRDACSIDVTPFGLSLVGAASHNVSTAQPDAEAFVERVRALTPDVVIMCGQSPMVASVLSAAQARDVNARAWLATPVLTESRSSSLGALFSTALLDVVTDTGAINFATTRLAGDTSCDIFTPFGCPRALAANYSAAFGQPLPTEATAVFAALGTLVQAITSAGSVDPAVIAATMRGRYFDTVFGRVVLGYGSRQNNGPIVVRQARVAGVGAGGVILPQALSDVAVVLPLEHASGALVYPAPTWGSLRCAAAGGCGEGGVCGDDGACLCRAGFSGARCSTAFGLPLFIAGLSVGGLAMAGGAAWLAAWCARRRDAQRLAAEERTRKAADDAAAGMHTRVLAWALHEQGNPLHVLSAVAEEAAGGFMPPARALRTIISMAGRLRRVLDDMAALLLGPRVLLSSPLQVSDFSPDDLLRDVTHRLQRMYGVVTVLSPGSGALCGAPAATPGAVVAAAPLSSVRLQTDPLRLYQLLVQCGAAITEAASTQRDGSHVRGCTLVLTANVHLPPSTSDATSRLPASAASRYTATEALPWRAATLIVRGMVEAGDARAVGGATHVAARPGSDVTTVTFHSRGTSAGTSSNGVSSDAGGSQSAAGASSTGGPVTMPLPHNGGAGGVLPPTAGVGATVSPTQPPPARGAAGSAHPHSPPARDEGAEGVTAGLPMLPPLAMLQPADCVALATVMGGALDLNIVGGHFSLTLPLPAVEALGSGSSADRSDVEVDVASNALGPPHGVPSTTRLAAAPGSASRRTSTPRRMDALTSAWPLETSSGGDGGPVGTPMAGAATLEPPATPVSTGDEGDLPAAAGAGAPALAAARHPRRVLVIDDEVAAGKLAARAAARAGWGADVLLDAADVPWADVARLSAQYDLILLDIVMKRSNGVDACRRLRAAGCGVRVVAMTANTGAADVALYRAAGFDGLLGKPFAASELRCILEGGKGWE
jgi:CheY-like chemotaxis protein